MKQSLILSVSAVAMISFFGCGSSSSSDDKTQVDDTSKLVTAQFIDAEVSGLTYTCSSTGDANLTNSKGEFTCAEGDSVVFSLDKYSLGTVVHSASKLIIMPEDLHPQNQQAELNVAQLLQTLDTDASDEIITISKNFSELNELNISVENENFDELMGQALRVQLVSEDQAREHINGVKAKLGANEETLSSLLSGTTQYTINSNNVATVKTFNADGTYSGSVTAGDRDPFDTTGTYRVENGVLYFTRLTPAEATFVVTYVSSSAGGIVLSGVMNGGPAFDTYFYTSKDDRDAFIANMP